jgi:hypothetical protein
MKKSLVTLLMASALICGVVADEALRLSQEEAKQLHALILVGELQDFGARASSASAYLMAAELLLDYPSREQNRTRVVELCGQARELERDDELVQAWADRLETRVNKSIRGPRSDFLERVGLLEPSQSIDVTGSYRGAWLHGEGVRLEMTDENGKPVEAASSAALLRVVNDDEEMVASYQLILLK